MINQKPINIFLILIVSVVSINSHAKTYELKRIKDLRSESGSKVYLEDNLAFPKQWHLKDLVSDNLLGSSVEHAYSSYPEIHSGQEIIVAIIDSGIDVNHESLNKKIWINKKEIPNNNIDDDKNGYIDDYMGWNFLGSSNPAAMAKFNNIGLNQSAQLIQGDQTLQLKADTLEKTRYLNNLKAKESNPDYVLSIEEKNELQNLEALITKKRSRAKNLFESYSLDLKVFNKSLEILSLKNKNISINKLRELSKTLDLPLELKAVDTIINLLNKGSDYPYLIEQVELYQTQYEVHFNSSSLQRTKIIGDDPKYLEHKYYGNNDVIGPNSLHGTHVAGILAAYNANKSGAQGIAKNIKIMPIRAIPDGDERDKDIINAIYYAVNNGARIINMSFGKYRSPHKQQVQKALLYAKNHNVLIVQAAGNEYKNLDDRPSYPNPFINKKKMDNYLIVASSNPSADDTLVTSFSNYGKSTVDFLAPGSYIFSTLPNNKYAAMSGTSMAAPIVSGIGAILLSQDPSLTPAQLKYLITAGTKSFENLMIFKTGIGRIRLSELFQQAGVVNLYNSLNLLFDFKNLANL